MRRESECLWAIIVGALLGTAAGLAAVAIAVAWLE